MGVGERERRETSEDKTKMSARNLSISLNCSLTAPSTLTTPTPNTPEILNAIINISSNHGEKMSANEIQLKTENTTENDLVEVQNAGQGMSSQKMFEDNNINRYHSQFIREGLKMKVKQKIKEETFQTQEASFGFNDINDGGENLTFEDEERRLRRRERNKVAATKCRNKKKERTTRLIAEGEVLEIQNSSLKDELRKLEAEKRSLNDLLSQHRQVCVKKRKLSSDRFQTKHKRSQQSSSPLTKGRTLEDQRPHLAFNQTNMESFQNYNYYPGYQPPEIYMKDEADDWRSVYREGGGAYQTGSMWLPGTEN